MNLDLSAETVEQYLASLSPQEREAILALGKEQAGKMIWTPQPGPQTNAYISTADELFYGGEAGGGKGFHSYQNVVTPFGWKEIGKLEVGSAICATDGTVQHVVAKYDRGKQPLYKLSWSDGSETVCDADHLWLSWQCRRATKKANKRTFGEDGAKIRTAAQMFAHYQKPNFERLAIPVISSPCVFTVSIRGGRGPSGRYKARFMPPYVLGVLLGDGCISGEDATFTKPDIEIADRVEALMKARHGAEFKLSRYMDRHCPTFYIPRKYCIEDLTDLGLMGCKSETKFIPEVYLWGTIPERWELLRGLMDTDGWSEEDGDCYYGTSSEQLATDVTQLARSLGAIVTRRERDPFYTYQGERKQGQKAYTLRIKMREPERMFTLERKADQCRGKEPQTMAIFLNDIQPHGEGETVCIVVSHPNRLFITEDFIVTHNSDLVLGLAINEHKDSLIIREFRDDAQYLMRRADEIISGTGVKTKPNKSDLSLSFLDRMLDFRGCRNEEEVQRFKGKPHDFIAPDEVGDLPESVYTFIQGWNRSKIPGQRCRVVATGNPPTRARGLWVIKRWAPWIDDSHPNPAKCGELRWYTTIGGKDTEVDGRGPHHVDGVDVFALSRTFFRARLSDNAYYGADYAAKLAALPEALRRAYRDGQFFTTLEDGIWQTIPTAWIQMAQKRWTPNPPAGVPMTAMGVDCAQGGKDRSALACRYDWWFAPVVTIPGEQTPDGPTLAGQVIKHRRDGCVITIDMGGGYGGSVMDCLKANLTAPSMGDKILYGFKGVEGSSALTVDRQLGFVNKRAEAWWKFREALDPGQPGGSPIALPEDNELLAELAAPEFQTTRGGLQIEDKKQVNKRLGRSIDKADAVVQAWANGPKGITPRNNWGATYRPGRSLSNKYTTSLQKHGWR